jgi:hypothetical protein
METAPGLENQLPFSGGERGFVEGSDPSDPYLLHERFQDSKKPLHGDKFFDDEIFLGA